MPTIRTRSYAPGTRTSTFTKGSTTKEETWSWSPPPAGGGGDQTVQVTVNRTTGAVPLSVMFEAYATGWFADAGPWRNIQTRHQHELRYKWTFNDGGPYSALRRSHRTPWGNDSSIAYEWASGHVFETPGDYVVQCEVTDGTTTITRNVTITATDQDAGWPDTIVMAPDNDFTGAPSGSSTSTSTNLSDVWPSSGQRRRIILKSGFDYQPWGTDRASSGVLVTAWGSGTRPRILQTSTTSGTTIGGSSHENVIFDGIRIESDYDPVTATMGNGASDWQGGPGFESNVNAKVLFNNCLLSGFGIALRPFNSHATNPEMYMHLNNSVITDFGDYGWFGGYNKAVLSGCRIEDNYDTRGGGNGTKSLEPRHSLIRTSEGAENGYFVVDNGEWFHTFGHPHKNGVPNVQNQLRWNSSDNKYSGGIFTRVLGDSGARMLGGGSNKSTEPTVPGNFIADKVMFIHHSAASGSYAISRGGSTLRNWIAVMPKHLVAQLGYSEIVQLWPNAAKYNDENANEPARIYSGSILEWTDPVEFGNQVDAALHNDDGLLNDVVIENIVRYSPNLRTPITDDVTLEYLDLNPLYRGLYYYAPVRSAPNQQLPRDPESASPTSLVGVNVSAGTWLAQSMNVGTSTGHTIEEWSNTAGTIVLNTKVSVDANGVVTRSGSGSFSVDTIEQVAIRHTFSDRDDYVEVINLRIVAGSSVQRMVALPVPSGSLLTENPAGLHALDYIDGTLRNGARVRGAVKPA